MAKDIKYGADARTALEAGVNKLALPWQGCRASKRR